MPDLIEAIEASHRDHVATLTGQVERAVLAVEQLTAERNYLRAELAELRQRGDALAAAAEEVLAAMEMQLARECGESHIPQSTARHIWDEAMQATSAALKAWRGKE